MDAVVRHIDPAQVRPAVGLHFRVPQSIWDQDFSNLKASIAHACGNVQPIKVVVLASQQGASDVASSDVHPGPFELIFGSRRLQACRELGLPVLALVVDRASAPEGVVDLVASNSGAVPPVELGRLLGSALSRGLFPSTRNAAERVGLPLQVVAVAIELAQLLETLPPCLVDPRAITGPAAKAIIAASRRDPAGFMRRAQALAAGEVHRSDAARIRQLLGRIAA